MQIQDLFDDIIVQLKCLDESEPDIEKRLKWLDQQHKYPGVTAYGISLPRVRRVIRKYRIDFQQLTLEERFELANLLYFSGNFEQATVADTLVEYNFPVLKPLYFGLLDDVVGSFNNWASVDWMCLHGFQSLLLKYRNETLDLLRDWNQSEGIWKRRSSVVAFVRQIGSSGDFTADALEMCENLIWDYEDLVQKGVGWALKDKLSGNNKRVLAFIKEIRRKGVSSTIILYAIRDLKGDERAEVLAVKPL